MNVQHPGIRLLCYMLCHDITKLCNSCRSSWHSYWQTSIYGRDCCMVTVRVEWLGLSPIVPKDNLRAQSGIKENRDSWLYNICHCDLNKIVSRVNIRYWRLATELPINSIYWKAWDAVITQQRERYQMYLNAHRLLIIPAQRMHRSLTLSQNSKLWGYLQWRIGQDT